MADSAAATYVRWLGDDGGALMATTAPGRPPTEAAGGAVARAQRNRGKLLGLLRTGLRPYRRSVAALVGLQFVQTAAALYLPTLNADLIDDGVIRGDTHYVLREGGLMLLFTLVQVVASLGAVLLSARTAMALGRDLRAAVFGRVLEFSGQDVARFGAPSLITRNTNDVAQVQTFLMTAFTMAVPAPVMCIGGIVLALRQDLAIVARMRPLYRRMQTRIDTVNRVLREQIAGIRVVRAFVREQDENARFGVANAELSDVSMRVGRLMALMLPALMLVVNASSVAVLWFGGHLIDAGRMQVGALTAFLSYLMQILGAVMMATFTFIQLPRAEVCAERMVEVLDTRSELAPPAQPVHNLVAPGEFAVRDVDFRYPGAEAPVLRAVSFVAVPGGVTAIVGSTGAGKSTLLSLAPRLVDVTGGAVLVGGVDVRSLAPEVLAATIGYVPQRPYLFSGTVASNLRMGRPAASDTELWAALEVAQARGFVEAMGGLAARIAQGGANVSGGQRQRLAIARALVARPRLYLFDDSFSALDHATDAALRTALRPWLAGATAVVVAQRVGTIRDADRIVVLDAGAVVGIGTHEQLLDSCLTYRQIVASQLSSQEAT
jgi:ATP-binding cassette subfamily B protein